MNKANAQRPRLPGDDTRPWYTHFWPWFLFILPACVVAASITTMVIASRGADDLVASDYYKDGLAINQRLERSRRAAELGIEPALAFDARGVRVAVTAPGDPEFLRLFLSHPLEADDDFTLELSRVTRGEYAGSLPSAVAPRWHWRLEPLSGEWRVDGLVMAADLVSERGP